MVVASPLLQGSAQPAPQQPASATAAARNAALIAATDEVLKETSELRQLSIIKPVPSSTQSREEIQRAIIKNLNEETSSADLHASEVLLKKLGLAPPDFNYRDLIVRLLTEQVAGYYEPKTQQFHLADWIDLDGQKPIMAHELTHALQDQHFNLRRFDHWPKGDSDGELAAHSLIEGDATLAMVLYIASNPLRALTFLKSIGTMAGASEELNKAPRAVRESLLFPYQEGLNWTRDLYRLGGWSEVSEAFTTLPQSTEQILHPAKYVAREAPVKVVLPDLTVMLNSKRSEVRSQRSVNAGQNSSVVNATGKKLNPTPNTQSSQTWKRIASDVKLARPFRIAIDCGNGVAGMLAPRLYRRLGCEVEELYCEVDGRFPNHHPDPSQPKNLQELIQTVNTGKAELGIAFDGDGDRLGLVAKDGEIIFADRQLMLLAKDVLGRNPGAQIIYDVKSTRLLAPWIERYGGKPLIWKTGHSLIKAKLKETGAPLAGEMSGHTFFKERWYGFDDALYGGARLLEVLSREKDPSAVLKALPNAPSTPELHWALAEGEPHALVAKLQAAKPFPGAERVLTIDGVRVEYRDGFGLARASNTTPVIVIRFEADSDAALERIKTQFRKALQPLKPDAPLPY